MQASHQKYEERKKGLAQQAFTVGVDCSHGFFQIGILETPFCNCIRSKSTAGTNKLLQFDQKLFPCRNVAPVQPKVQGKQSGTDNLILATNEPLVPIPMTPLVWALIYSTNWRKLIK